MNIVMQSLVGGLIIEFSRTVYLIATVEAARNPNLFKGLHSHVSNGQQVRSQKLLHSSSFFHLSTLVLEFHFYDNDWQMKRLQAGQSTEIVDALKA